MHTPLSNQPHPASSTIVVVEDNPHIRQLLQDFLSLLVNAQGCSIILLAEAHSACEYLHHHPCSVLITDLNLGFSNMDGFNVVDAANLLPQRPFVIVISSVTSLDKVNAGLNSGSIDRFLHKPFSLQQLGQILPPHLLHDSTKPFSPR
jgi:DNA-binding response OmpR family regulator